MGQGYSSGTVSAGSAGIDVPELTDLSFEKSLGDARFMKAIRARHRDGLAVAKVVVKPYAGADLSLYIKAIENERRILSNVPNAIGYHRIFETSSNGFLVRQFIYSSLYDRMSTRPFLEDIEKKWLAFQLLTALRDCHSQSIYHGDIKTENTLVTSWNWLLLADFSSSFKPTYLPEDNPAEFSFSFDISGRRTCYIAPERFLLPGESSRGRSGVTWAMDIFSAGCVIAELFLETPIFTLSQLFNYRQGEHDPASAHLNKIEDADVRELVSHMIQLEPESRYSADEYLNFWRQRTFPDYFYSFLHQYMHVVSDPTSGRSDITAGTTNLGESDERIERVYSDFDKISYFLDFSVKTEGGSVSTGIPINPGGSNPLPLYVDLPNKEVPTSSKPSSKVDSGTILFLGIITSALRSTAHSSAKIRACDLFMAFCEFIPDEARLDRILPFVVGLLDDKSDTVRLVALRTLSRILQSTTANSQVHAYLFPEYIIPKLLDVMQPKRAAKPKPLVRIAYAQSMSSVVTSAARFLDTAQALKVEGSLPDPAAGISEDRSTVQPQQDVYDIAKGDLVKFFETQTKALLTDNNSDVRRAFLGSVAGLCIFFGTSKANDVVLSHLNTYLNDRDWRLKCAFFETIVGVATYVGSNSLEEFILPLMVQALTDPEENVVQKVISSLATMAQLGLLQRATTWDLLDLVARFLMHPNLWVREAACVFISSSTRFMSVADCYCIAIPIIRPYLTKIPASLSQIALTESLKPQLPRAVFDLATTWACSWETSSFWRIASVERAASRQEGGISGFASSQRFATSFEKLAKSETDQQWIRRLQHAGMGRDDEMKILALRDYIYRVARRGNRGDRSAEIERLNKIVKLGELKITLNNVLFDQKQGSLDGIAPREQNVERDRGEPQTISDALLDASTTIGLPDSRRNSSPNTTPRSNLAVARSDPRAIKARSPIVSSPLASSPRDVQQDGAGQVTSDPQKPPMRHRVSAMDLMSGRSASGKAIAATSTSSASAHGKVDISGARDVFPAKTSFAIAKDDKTRRPYDIRYDRTHNYRGRDPNVLRLLDNVYLEQLPVDFAEFGPKIVPYHQRQDVDTSDSHHPPGMLVAMFSEHTKPVTHLVPAPDHAFFLTGSDDGTIRIWDTSRLERNLAHRSRQIYRHGNGTQITALCFVEDTHAFASAASDGSVHLVRVDCQTSPSSTSKYGRLKIVRQWQIPPDVSSSSTSSPYATCLAHFRPSDSGMSILLLSSSDCVIRALDIRTMDVVYTLVNPTHHGIPTTFCLDPEKQWLLVGTANGVLDLWDLRFRLRLKSAAFPAAKPIEQVVLFPGARGKLGGRKVCVAGGTEQSDITVWEVERLVCREVFRTQAASNVHGKSSAPYTAWRPDDVSQSAMLERLSSSSSSSAHNSQHSAPPSATVHAFAPCVYTTPSSQPSKPGRRHGYLIAGGSDAVVRQWDLEDPERSRIISGADHIGAGEEQASSSSSSSNRKKGRAGDAGKLSYERATGIELTIWEEHVSGTTATSDARPGSPTSRQRDASHGSEGPSTGGRKANVGVRRDRGSSSGGGGGASRAPEASSNAGGASAQAETEQQEEEPTPSISSRQSRQTAVSQQQHRLLRSHLDTVLACCVLESPFRMVVSADRSGVVYVFT
ncbi:MAG: Serine/threonine-protein kinase [Chrysothrix sp. TS-e1954]|nr:MAG: Serine/threonine-protein kinase [Chrysothrix sp. TS-e1954]